MSSAASGVKLQSSCFLHIPLTLFKKKKRHERSYWYQRESSSEPQPPFQTLLLLSEGKNMNES